MRIQVCMQYYLGAGYYKVPDNNDSPSRITNCPLTMNLLYFLIHVQFLDTKNLQRKERSGWISSEFVLLTVFNSCVSGGEINQQVSS